MGPTGCTKTSGTHQRFDPRSCSLDRSRRSTNEYTVNTSSSAPATRIARCWPSVSSAQSRVFIRCLLGANLSVQEARVQGLSAHAEAGRRQQGPSRPGRIEPRRGALVTATDRSRSACREQSRTGRRPDAIGGPLRGRPRHSTARSRPEPRRLPRRGRTRQARSDGDLRAEGQPAEGLNPIGGGKQQREWLEHIGGCSSVTMMLARSTNGRNSTCDQSTAIRLSEERIQMSAPSAVWVVAAINLRKPKATTLSPGGASKSLGAVTAMITPTISRERRSWRLARRTPRRWVPR
jgi:hypothetical protein